MRSFGSARPCADSVRPLSCILARRACSVGFASCETLGKHYHASLRLRSLGSARPCADSVRPPSCIHARPASCGFSLPPHQKIMPRLLSGALFLVPMAGVEPARYCYQRILSPSRLPIPSHRLIKMCCKTALHNGNNDFTV